MQLYVRLPTSLRCLCFALPGIGTIGTGIYAAVSIVFDDGRADESETVS